MKTTAQEITEIENFYKNATPAEAFEYFKKVSAKCFTAIDAAIKSIGRKISGKKKSRSCLSPMKCRTVYPAGYDLIAARYPRRSIVFRMGYRGWREYLMLVRMARVFKLIKDQIEMEELLVQAQEILIK